MKVLVTGGAGFIGSHVVDALLSRGDSVVVVDEFNDYYNPAFKRDNVRSFLHSSAFSLEECDIRDKSALGTIFSIHKPDSVIHIAARAGVRPSLTYPELYYAVNVDGTRHVLDSAIQYGTKHLVYASSSSVYGSRETGPFRETDDVTRQISPYAKTKKICEDMCEKYHKKHGLSINTLRFFTVYGPRGRPDMAPYKFVSRILNGESIERYGDGSTKRDYTYIDDIRKGVIAALDKPFGFEIFNLGNNQTVRLSRFIEVIENITGKKASIIEKPPQKGDVPLTCADISKAESMLGYTPSTSIEEGMLRFVTWFKEFRQFTPHQKN